MMRNGDDPDRRSGPRSEAPWRIPARGWAEILHRAWQDTGRRDLSLVAGGVSFCLLLALFPAVGALVSVYGLVASPADVPKNVHRWQACVRHRPLR